MSKQHTINHFSHNHPLTKVNVVGSYTCDGCKLYGDGKSYRCMDCDYDLHEYCATCPRSLINSCHGPDHELSLIDGPTHMTERGCYVCRVYIQGMFYKCKHCSFESHPLCTHVSMHASSPDATITKERSLNQHGHVSQPVSPHHYGQGNSYGYSTMGPYGSDPHGDHQHHRQHQHHHHHHHHHHHQNPYMNLGSPNADHSAGSSSPKTKKKTPGIMGAVRVAAGVTAAVVITALTGV